VAANREYVRCLKPSAELPILLTMAAKPDVVHAEKRVELDGDRVHIRELSVDGIVTTLVRQALADERDPETVLCDAIAIGAAVLLHGTSQGTVDAVAAQVDRLLAVLDEKSSRIEALSRMREQVSASKGLAWEEHLGARLDACFAPHGDELEATGATPGIADDKTGDYVVTVNPRDTGGRDRRIVFEAKARKRRPPLATALEELDHAMLNRDCQVAVLVFPKKSQSPLQGKPLRVFHGNRILTVWDEEEPGSDMALDVAAQLARTLAIAAEREDLTLDRRMLAERLDALTNIIERGAAIRRGVRTARRGLDAAEDAYEQLVEEASAVILELMDRL
jgi:hypothetical protein